MIQSSDMKAETRKGEGSTPSELKHYFFQPVIT